MKILLIKTDLVGFVRKNFVKLLMILSVGVIAGLVAVHGGVVVNDACEVCEKSNNIIILYFNENRSLLSILFARLFESALILAVILLCSFNDLTCLLSPVVLAYKAYTTLYFDILILRCNAFFGIIYFVLHTVSLLLWLCVYASASCKVINSACRCSYGFKELNVLCKQFVPIFIAVGVAIVVETIVIFVGGIFI